MEPTAQQLADATIAGLRADNERMRAALGRLGTMECMTTEGWGFGHPEITARVEFALAALTPIPDATCGQPVEVSP